QSTSPRIVPSPCRCCCRALSLSRRGIGAKGYGVPPVEWSIWSPQIRRSLRPECYLEESGGGRLRRPQSNIRICHKFRPCHRMPPNQSLYCAGGWPQQSSTRCQQNVEMRVKIPTVAFSIPSWRWLVVLACAWLALSGNALAQEVAVGT